jgi:beta-lactam-binding protein with PASTA domain
VDTALADPLAGSVLDGRYRIGARIARGGMSTVYLGTDMRLDRLVAVKVMAPALARDPVFVDRFAREARAAARLSHVNVVAVHDQGSAAGPDGPVVFLVMELVRGRTLRDLLRERGRLSADEATSLLEPVLAALAAAHRAGLVHRDVKPENVLLSDDGVVKVADFGLARAVAATTATTQAGVVLGTAAYVAPEQVSRGAIDPRTDVYSAGIVLYELLTGAAPYVGDSAIAVAHRHVHCDVPPPSLAVPSIPPALDDLVLRATRREPGARPADAGAFLAELADVRADLGLRRVPAPIRTGRRAGPPDAAAVVARAAPAERPTVVSARPAAPPRPGATAALPAYRSGARPSGPDRTVHDERRAHRVRSLVGVAAILLLGLVAAGAGWWYGSGRFVDVPRLAGLSQQQALRSATETGLEVRFGATEHSERVPAGRVLRTDPGAGDRVRRGAMLLVVTSSGPPPVQVPDVVGATRDDATRALSGAGLQARVSQRSSGEVPEGSVISQSHRGQAVPRTTVITIVVSTGPDLVAVPRVVGKSLADATRKLQDRGFTVQAHDFFGGVLGRVWRQDPKGGTRAARGSTVTLEVL